MFQKARVAFSNKTIFGNKFSPAIDSCFLAVSKMLYSDKINVDGTIDITKSAALTLKDLWSYIYYLYYYNHTNVKIFHSMSNPKNGKANAELFYSTVTTFLENVNAGNENSAAKPLDTTTLIIFINNVIEEYERQIVNPIFDYLSVLMKKNIMTKLSSLNIVTGQDQTGIKIVTDPTEVENANVKIRLSLNATNAPNSR